MCSAVHAEVDAARMETRRNHGDEAVLQLMRRSLLLPAAVIAPVAPAQADASAKRVADQSLLFVERADIEDYARDAPELLRCVSEANVPLEDATGSRFVVFREANGLREHVAILIGRRAEWKPAVPVRLHSACLTGDLFGSLRCDCGDPLRSSVAKIAAGGGGVLLYLAQEGRGIGLANKMRAYALQDQGLDTADADQSLGFGEDERHYGGAIEILAQLDIDRVDLLTNNPTKITALNRGGIAVTDRQSIYGRVTTQNERYLTTKSERAGHWLDILLDKSAAPGKMSPCAAS